MLLTHSRGTTFANTFEAWEYFGHDGVPIVSVSGGRPKPKYREAIYLGRGQLRADLRGSFSVGGKWVVAVVAELLLAFATLRWLGIRRIRKSERYA
jgi:hypothetical protein